jgi:hypothetical protein
MTAIATLPVLFQEGDHASRPAAGDVGSGALYSCTTHNLIYQTDGATWTTWATLGGGTPDLDAVIAVSGGQDISDALSGAAAPDAGNVFATMADIGGGGDITIVGGATAAIDLGAVTLLQRRAVTNTEDDLFNAALDGRWTAYGTPANNVSDKAGWLHVTTGGYYVQAVVAGDYTVQTEVVLADSTTAAYQDSGLILTNGTTIGSATDARFGVGNANALQTFRFVFEKFVNGAFSSTYSTWDGGGGMDPAQPIHMRIVRSSTTNFYCEVSYDGWNWHRLFSTGSLGFTPTHFGIGGDAGSYFNGFYRY